MCIRFKNDNGKRFQALREITEAPPVNRFLIWENEMYSDSGRIEHEQRLRNADVCLRKRVETGR